MDQIGDGLGLRQINPAIEKCALGKFARFGQRAPFSRIVSRTSFAGRIPPWQEISTVSSRVNVRGARRTASKTSSTVSPLRTIFPNESYVNLQRMVSGNFFRRAGKFYQRLRSLRAGNSDDGQSAFAERRSRLRLLCRRA